MDQCEHCTIRGKIKECLAEDCSLHEIWMAMELMKMIVRQDKKIEELTKKERLKPLQGQFVENHSADKDN